MSDTVKSRPKLKDYFDTTLAITLAEKIQLYYPTFDADHFVHEIASSIDDQEMKQRIETMADALFHHLPADYYQAAGMLKQILGPENTKETGMFSQYYWLMPVAFFVEKYGLNWFDTSISLIEEITKRNTGEYAIRPFLLAYPDKTLAIAEHWSHSKNFHLRRLASEGLRPRLPWAKKIILFSQNPTPVFHILDTLKSDPSAYVRKSVANNMADFLKENYHATIATLKKWKHHANTETRWIIKHALRNEVRKNNPEARNLIIQSK